MSDVPTTRDAGATRSQRHATALIAGYIHELLQRPPMTAATSDGPK